MRVSAGNGFGRPAEDPPTASRNSAITATAAKKLALPAPLILTCPPGAVAETGCPEEKEIRAFSVADDAVTWLEDTVAAAPALTD